MSYSRKNRDLFAAAQAATWWPPRAVRECHIALKRADYSVVDSRRETHEAVVNFVESGIFGEDLFGWNKRFPAKEIDKYFTDFNGQFGDLLDELVNSLSHRQTTDPKDVINARRPQEENYTEKNGERQDNTKRYEQLEIALGRLRRSPKAIWIRSSFERRVNADWTETRRREPDEEDPDPPAEGGGEDGEVGAEDA